MKIKVKNQYNDVKEIKLGFSWTTIFFGILVPLFRLDWKTVLVYLAVSVLGWFLGFSSLMTIFIVVFAFFYNKLYATQLFENGYNGRTPEDHVDFIRYIHS